MEKPLTELVHELFMKNPYESFSVIETKDQTGNRVSLLFESAGYNEYTQHILRCQSVLFKKPVCFYMTTIHDSIIRGGIEYDDHALTHEETLRHAITLALSSKPTQKAPGWTPEL